MLKRHITQGHHNIAIFNLDYITVTESQKQCITETQYSMWTASLYQHNTAQYHRNNTSQNLNI